MDTWCALPSWMEGREWHIVITARERSLAGYEAVYSHVTLNGQSGGCVRWTLAWRFVCCPAGTLWNGSCLRPWGVRAAAGPSLHAQSPRPGYSRTILAPTAHNSSQESGADIQYQSWDAEALALCRDTIEDTPYMMYLVNPVPPAHKAAAGSFEADAYVRCVGLQRRC